MTTRYAIEKQITALLKKASKITDVSSIERMDFSKFSQEEVHKMVDRNAKLFTELETTMSDFRAMCYACRLKEMSLMGKIEISRDTLEEFEKIENIIENVFWKAKPQKIQAVEAILFYLKYVGCDYSVDFYDELLHKVKARKPHVKKDIA
jgi:hypothetical protein